MEADFQSLTDWETLSEINKQPKQSGMQTRRSNLHLPEAL